MHSRLPAALGAGIVWAESRSKARFLAASSYAEAFNAPMRDALAGMRVVRAPEYDRATRRFPARTVLSQGHVDAVLREEADHG